MTVTVEERVAAGAAWLDKTEPGWERRIDLAVLDLSESCRCVLGQLFRGNVDSKNWMPYKTGYGYAIWTYQIDDEALGFAAFNDNNGNEYGELHEAWIALLKERFDSGLLSDA